MFIVRVQTEILIVGTKFLRFETPNQIVNKANSENNARGRLCDISIKNKAIKHRNI